MISNSVQNPGREPSAGTSLISRIVEKSPAIQNISHVPLEGDVAILSSLKGYASVAKDAAVLLDGVFDHNSFLVSEVNKPSCTEAISACTGVGISNGNQSLICHFNPMVFYDETQAGEILSKIKSVIDSLRLSATASLKAIVYSGDDTNSLPIEKLLHSEGIATLSLINQKLGMENGAGYEGGFAYIPETDKWHVHTYLRRVDGVEHAPKTDVTTRAELADCFDRITFTPATQKSDEKVGFGVFKSLVCPRQD